MNARLQYEIRGWAYWTKCLNPLRDTITIRGLPLGLQLKAYKRDAIGRGLYRRKVHEPAVTKLLLERFGNPGEHNFIDVGANIGYFSGLMSRLAGPTGKVLAIEPEPSNLRLLRENLAANRLTNVVIHPCALGSSEGFAMLGLYKAANRGRHSIVDADAKQKIKVPIRSLDSLVRASAPDVRSWSLAKIDVEGYEAFVIDGATETLPKVEVLVMEFSPVLLKKAGRDPAAMLSALCAHFPSFHRIEGAEIARTTADECLRNEKQIDLLLER